MRRIAIVSDIHYAGPGEKSHGADYEFAHAQSSLRTALVRLYRHHVWMRNPTAHNGMLDEFIRRASEADLVIANGDYTCDVAGVGVSHDESFESARLCLGKLRDKFGNRLHATIGDHELGKIALMGDHGGLRLRSWRRAVNECGLNPFWRVEVGQYILLGIASTLVALPVFRPDALDDEWPEWEQLRASHLDRVRAVFADLKPDQRVILFCHDPTALSFLAQEAAVRDRFNQIERTIVGHLHTQLVFWKSRLLAGMAVVKGMGVSVNRMTTALNQARHWKPFKPVLCPALSGIELFKTGGFLTLHLDESGKLPSVIQRHRFARVPESQ